MKKNLIKKSLKMTRIFLVLILCFALTGIPSAFASSHAEAPLTSRDPFADNTDTYAFRSLEAGRSGFVTLIASLIPFQLPSGGPQFYRFDDEVLYEINIDNTGDGAPDIVYQFDFTTQIVNPNTVFGHTTVNENAVVSSLTDPDYNMPQTYTVIRLDSSTGANGRVIASGLRTPPSNVGPRVTPNYETNLGQPAVYNVAGGGKVFAGQRDDGFYIDLGGVFDAFNLRSLGASGGVDTLRTLNVNTIAIEVPIQNLTRTGTVPTNPLDPNAVIGVWSTTERERVRVLRGGFFDSANTRPRNTIVRQEQISRLGNPLVNELIIPLRQKDQFNSLSPFNDFIFAQAILDPELPKLIQTALAVFNGININIPPPPRNDLVAIFATGIPAGTPGAPPNYTTFLSDGAPHEMMRLNVAIAPVPIGAPGYSRLGLLGGDIGGFPNGRRIGDDVVDIEIRAALGGTPFTPAFNVAPNNSVGDGVAFNFEGYLTRFPYLQTPNPGNTPREGNFPALQTPPGGRADDNGELSLFGLPDRKLRSKSK